jgi:D-3-phosphoglycerate dehydrogenase
MRSYKKENKKMKNLRILANDGISQEARSILEENGHYVSTDKIPQDILAQGISNNEFDVLIVRSATEVRSDVIDGCPNLKLIVRAGVGIDNIDAAYAESKGITVMNTPAASSRSVAELVIGQMFSAARMLHDASRNMQSFPFEILKKKYSKGIELKGKTLGIVGIGRIGTEVAKYALGIGMNVVAADISAHKKTIEIEIAGKKIEHEIDVKGNMEDILPICDFITFHIPRKQNGDSAIGRRELYMMKKGAILINASRGGVINEDDLLESLSSRQIAFAALDVFENEPDPNPMLVCHPNILPTPHIGAATTEAQDRIGQEIAQIVSDFANL